MKKIFTLCLVLCMSYLSMGATNLKHEFRATWLTTAWGNDWPKTKVTNDATRKQQQDSLIAIFDRLQAGNMNAVCMQVRGRSDAFYQSSYEPWAAELAGARGTNPGYDPLAFAIEEAHKRGLELHAWVNPFRVTSAGTLASTDLVKKNAGQWIIQYNNGSFTGEIIDPGYPEAREYVLNVLMEIISNYDIDGIVMDDYFYPYGGTTTEDAASKALHKPANVVDVNKDGKTDDDWRRSNVDVFLKEFYNRIQTTKPWVRLGMGTFGIWTTQTKVAQAYGISLPSGISGLDDYDEQACNPVEWVQNGYVDYINPQLYWPTTSISQNYNKLCQWWAKDVCEHFSNQLTNGKKVHFFSSQSISSNSAVSEIQAEIDANRNNLSSGSTGSVFFDTDAYLNMDNALMTSRFATHALPPAMDWKSNTALAAPTNLTVSGSTLTWQHATAERFTVYVYPKGIAWSTAKNDPAYLQGVIYGNSLDISGIDTNMNDIAVCAYDRFGVEHETAIYGATPGDVTPPASGTITYELNGGVQSSYLTAQDMYADLNVDYNAATGATAAWLSLAECTATNQGIPTAVASMDVTFFTAAGAEKWGWLATYVDKVSADQAVAVASSSSASMRYNLQSFFKNWQHTGWPKSANYTTCGVSTLDAYQPYWKSSFANPTEPTAEVTLYAPYKEGATFDGWYAAADFSGEKVTKIDANTTGTLYAKWVEYIPTIAEVKALADDVVTNVSGVVNHIQGRNLYIQDATGGILVYTSEDPTCKVGDKIVAKGVKAIYGGAPEVKNAVINTTEAGTLAPAQTFEGLSELVADIKYFATRVTVPGLKIVSYDSYNNPTVTDGVNEALCYRMSLDPAQFPIGSKITITAVAGWYNGFQFVGDVAGIELVVIGKKDKYEYPVRNSEEHSYTLINDWVISNNEDNFAANAPGKTDYVRGMAVKDGIMYFINRDTKSIVPVVGATAEMLDPIVITGEHLFERIGENGEWESACKLPFNDIKFDQAGNCLIGSCVSGDGTFQIYLVDLETGAATLVVEERLYDNPDFLNNGYRFDAFGVAGDVTQNGVIMAADATSGSWNVYRWLITDGEVAPAEQITMLLDPEYDQSLFINAAGWGTAPQIFPKDEIGSLFYVDGFNMLPMLFDEGGMLVDDFINCPTQKEVTNKDGDVLMMNTGHNGLVEFQVGDEYFLLMAAGNTAAAVPSSFALFKFADEGRTFDGLEPLWYFPANGMGTSTNGCRTAVPSVEVVDDKTANLYLYTNNNGYARYTLNIGETTAEVIDPTWQITYTSTYGKIVTPYATDVFGANIVSNTYKDGVGTITFDGPVTSIGNYAFYSCSGLTSITIPNSVTSIGNYAFYSCSGLTSITIPNSVTSIGNLAFSYCSRLTSIVVDGENTTYDSREKCNAIIETATNTLIAGCQNTIIPNSVTSIGNYAFSGCSGLTSITIPNSVKSIGRYAFDSCSGLTSITIPNSVTSIGNCAFSQCTSLTSITIPNSVTSFGYNAFVNCSGLTSIVVDVENTTYDSRENCNAIIETATNTLIAGCQNTIIPDNVTSIGEGAFYGCSSLTSITIPDNVTSIGESAFVYCTSLTSITIPNSVTSIGHFAFGFCINLASVFIPNSITNIESTTFDSCTSLTSITIPNSVTHIGFQAFLNCTSLTTIHVEATTPPALEDSTVFMNTPSPICVIPCGTLAAYQASDWASQVSEFVEDCVEGQQIYYTSTDGNIVTPNINAFDANIVSNIYENGVGTLTFDGPITIVGDSAFHECSTLTSITIPNSVTSIGWSAFFRCSSLTSITIPNSVTSIGWSAFSRCSSLTSITIPNSVTSIGMYAFFGCSSLISITIPNSVTSIGENAFDSCDKLTSMVVESGNIIYDSRENCNAIIKTATSTLIAGCQNTIIPSSVMSIGGAAFSGCSSLISITIPNSVTSIGWSAFYRCSSLTSVTIPNSVTSIGENAFSDCSSLTFITIPNSVTSIGYGAFRDCSSLTSITIPNSVTSIGSQAFADCSSLASVTVGNSVTSIGSQAFWGCSSLTSITIPNSVTSIGDYAFYDCSSLTSITIPNSVTSIGEGAFKYCSSLDTIHVEATTPPTLGEDVFYKTPSPICVIPCGTIAAYEASDWASQVGRFEEDCVEGQQIFYTSTDGNIVIPYATDVFGANIVSNTYENGVGTITFDGPVTCIGNYAFDECSSLTSVTIGNSVTSIGDGAFYVCSSLTSITIPNSVTSIGDYAFSSCSGLTSITIPNSVTSIGSGAFSFCPSLTSIVVEGENMTYDSRENCNAIIETATNTLIAGCKNTIIPNSVTSIGYRAFFGCSSLTSITIPNSVTSIGYDAFCVCSKLKTLHVEATTPPALGKDAFNSTPTCHIPCGTLAAYRASNWAQYVGKFSGNCPPLVVKAKVPAFWENDVITVWVWTDGDGTEYPTTKDGDWYVYTHTDYTDFNIIFKSGTDWKGDQYQTVDINGITDNTCLEIQSTSSKATYTFVDCAPVQQCGDDLYWEYADGVLTITGTGDMYDYADDKTGPAPWYDVRGSIKAINMPDEMTKIGDYAFYKCTALTSVTLPEQLKHIGNRAFAQDTKIAGNIVIPEGVNYIEERAFFNLTGVSQFQVLATTPPTLESTNVFTNVNAPIVIPCGYGLVYRKANIWKDLNLSTCEVLIDNLYYMPVGDNVAYIIGYDNKPAGTLTIPGSVVIGSKTRTVTTLADSLFFDCKEISSVIFNEGLESIGERAFVRSGLTGTIVLPSTLTTIGERAFSYCDNVEKYILQAMTPPALANDVFTGSNSKALFYISCEAMDDYKVATNWSSLKSRLRDACLNIYHYNTPLGTNGVYTTEDTLVASIYYRRQFTPYRWETLYLPFEVDRVTVLEDGEEFDLRPWNIITGGDYYLAKPDGMLNLEILFDFTDELESHTPYIIQFVYDYYRDKIITFYGKESWNKLSTSFEVLSSSSWMQIAGNTTMQDQLLEKPVYMLRSGLDFILQKTTTTLHPFECYVMPYATSSGAPARMNMRFRGDVPTAVESVKGNESHLTYSVDGYTLTVYPQGQAFSIYSLNGALIYSCEAGKEAVDCELNSGCYLLHAGAEAHKIML